MLLIYVWPVQTDQAAVPVYWSGSRSSLTLQLLSPLGICSPLQLLFTRSWPQCLHFSHFITITSDSNLLPNWVSNPKPDIQAVRWISSFGLVSVEASGQLTSGLLNVLGASAWNLGCRPVEQQCWVKHRNLSSSLELIIPDLLEILLIKNRVGFYPLSCCFSSFFPQSKAASLQSGHLVKKNDWFNSLGSFFWPFPFIVIYLHIKLNNVWFFFFLLWMLTPQVPLLFFVYSCQINFLDRAVFTYLSFRLLAMQWVSVILF